MKRLLFILLLVLAGCEKPQLTATQMKTLEIECAAHGGLENVYRVAEPWPSNGLKWTEFVCKSGIIKVAYLK